MIPGKAVTDKENIVMLVLGKNGAVIFSHLFKRELLRLGVVERVDVNCLTVAERTAVNIENVLL